MKLSAATLLGLIGEAFLFTGLGFYLLYQPGRHESLQQQQERLTQELWKIQDQFGLKTGSVRVEVRRGQDMLDDGKPCGCWGYGNFVENGDYSIAIQAMEDMPQAMPWSYRKHFQDTVLQHEVMHIVLHEIGVPSSFQDRIIVRLQPSLREP